MWWQPSFSQPAALHILEALCCAGPAPEPCEIEGSPGIIWMGFWGIEIPSNWFELGLTEFVFTSSICFCIPPRAFNTQSSFVSRWPPSCLTFVEVFFVVLVLLEGEKSYCQDEALVCKRVFLQQLLNFGPFAFVFLLKSCFAKFHHIFSS